jgi:hypothetical protein
MLQLSFAMIHLLLFLQCLLSQCWCPNHWTKGDVTTSSSADTSNEGDVSTREQLNQQQLSPQRESTAELPTRANQQPVSSSLSSIPNSHSSHTKYSLMHHENVAHAIDNALGGGGGAGFACGYMFGSRLKYQSFGNASCSSSDL